MAKTSGSGNAPPITPQDFNERLRLLLAGKPDPRKAEGRGFSARKPKPFLSRPASKPEPEV